MIKSIYTENLIFVLYYISKNYIYDVDYELKDVKE